MNRIDVEITKKNGLKIRGFLFLPDTPVDESPCVIVSHGFTSSTQSNINPAIAFSSNGIACLIFDFGGGSQNSISQGVFEDVSVDSEVDDLEDVISWVRENYNFKDLFLYGSSMGGFVSAIVAAREPDIKGLMLIFPAFVIPDDARALLNNPESLDENSPAVREALKKEVLELHAAWDYGQAIKNYHGPVLLIHGTEDKVVSLDYSQRALDIYDNAELIVYEGQGHGFDWEHKVTADDACLKFVKDIENE